MRCRNILNLKIVVQDEDKKSGAGDGHTTEDESSQDSKGESQPQAAEAEGNADVKPEETPGQKLSSTLTHCL